MTVPRPRRALVLGCGGPIGFAWSVGALRVLSHAWRWDPREADVILGTSAGAELAVMLGAGVGIEEIGDAFVRSPADAVRPTVTRHVRRRHRRGPPLALPVPGSWRLAASGLRRRTPPMPALSGLLPRGTQDSAWLAELADSLGVGTWVTHPATWLVACDYATGEPTAFGSPDAPAADVRDALRASWAIPGWMEPITIGGRTYVDGGIASPTSAHLLAGHEFDEVVIVAPMASQDPTRPRGLRRLEGLLRRPMSRRVDAETAELEAAGTAVVRLHPGADELHVMGANFMDTRRCAATYDIAVRVGATRVPA